MNITVYNTVCSLVLQCLTEFKGTSHLHNSQSANVYERLSVKYSSCAAVSLASSEGGNWTKRSPARLMSISYGRSWGIWDSRWWTMAMSHSHSSTSSSLYSTICSTGTSKTDRAHVLLQQAITHQKDMNVRVRCTFYVVKFYTAVVSWLYGNRPSNHLRIVLLQPYSCYKYKVDQHHVLFALFNSVIKQKIISLSLSVTVNLFQLKGQTCVRQSVLCESDQEIQIQSHFNE